LTESVRVKCVLRGLHAEGKKLKFSLTILDKAGNQIGARGVEVFFGATKEETKRNCVEAIKEVLRPVAERFLKEANMPDANELHLDFSGRSLNFDFPSETLTWGGTVEPPEGEGDYGPV